MSKGDHPLPKLPPLSSVYDILVVCSGNMCRSPMASVLLRATLQNAGVRGMRVHSAGTIASEGGPASADAITTCAAYGLDISYHRAKLLTAESVKQADIILVMEQKHRSRALELEPAARHKTFLLTEFAEGALHGKDLPDPVGTSAVYYEQLFNLMQSMIDNFVRLLVEEQPGDKSPG
jgi:protein-tyrosine-phosphatase